MNSRSRRAGVFLASAVVLLAASPACADMAGRWNATSSTALSVTGDITLSENTVIFANGERLRLTPVAQSEGMWTPLPATYPGTISRVTPPSDPVLLNGNRLCGLPVPVTYIVLSLRSGYSLAMTVFTGSDPPRGFGDQSCAVYFYER